MADIILVNNQNQDQTLSGVSKLVTRSTDGDVVFTQGEAQAEKTVGSTPTSKQTSIIYNSSDGKYYLWRYDNKCSI